MIKFCLKKWEENKAELEEDLRNDTTLNECDYLYLVKKVVSIVLNGGEYEKWDAENITEINNGEYQGTLLFLIPRDTYQPSECDYLMTYVGYGSCSYCDILEGIQNWDGGKLNEEQVKDFMTLCRDLICDMIKPYNYGWRNDEEFETVKESE